ncbi:MAG TPA: DNA recombination protein RmuC [Micropepsaceae bacterium]|nr:DNA recombination protein RmuC [Micropepsaceae bacterium]
MMVWISVLAIVAVLSGLGLTAYAVARVATALRNVEQQRQSKDGSEALMLDSKLRELAAAQSEIAGRFSQAIESQAKSQSELQRAVAERLEALDKRLGDNLKETASKTAETLGGLQTRLTVIDEAQKNLADLSGQVVSLQQILANKQARGAWGQGQMENIIRDALPVGVYEFQATLSNKNRPDCLIRMPGSATAIVIDSKFPLESFAVLKNAASDAEKRLAEARVRAEVGKHVRDIAEKYLIAGETQSPAIMFVPSESLYAELHDSFSDVIQKAQRLQVVVVSPNILLLAINTVQTVMKDARMRDQANLIQKEVGLMLNDVRLLHERVNKLQTHLGQADGDIKNILISTAKVAGRAERIERVELAGPDSAALTTAAE